MPAWPGERQRAIELGIHVLILLRPIEYVRDEAGRLVGVRCVRTRLAAAGENAREVPVDVAGSECTFEAGCVIDAIGQQPDGLVREALAELQWTEAGTLAVDERGQTSVAGVYAAGDLINGGATAAEAIAGAHRAADAILESVQSLRSG
jgi:NADPH-dependent glutamate synthase beta subunit-like oxidoreductase